MPHGSIYLSRYVLTTLFTYAFILFLQDLLHGLLQLRSHYSDVFGATTTMTDFVLSRYDPF